MLGAFFVFCYLARTAGKGFEMICVDATSLAKKITSGQRRALARGLTLVESSQPSHQEMALQLFSALKPARRSFRLGVTGPPGAGKSSLIESLVLSWVKEGDKVAILAVDPSSQRTGGSLLGDKTRMGAIAQLPNVFIRPSPTGDQLGGLGRRTSLMCSLLERAGFGRIIVETVGVGQSEISASYLVDKLLLVALPGAGDEVQGIKRGLMEEVDLIAVNKADLGTSKATVAVLRSALRVFRRDVPVIEVSAHTGQGLERLGELLSQNDSISQPERSRGELHFFDNYMLNAVRKMLTEDSADWAQLRDQVKSGEKDLLQVMPELTGLLQDLRSSLEEPRD